MIRFLRIRNLAVIDELELELQAGLTVLTGETGAGKSIVIGALGLLRGARASANLVRTGADRAIIEAITETTDGREQLLRREVSAQGRSRAFVDDRLVQTAKLREVGSSLLDLHGQHEHQALLDPGSHLDMLDQHAGLMSLRQRVSECFTCWRQATSQLKKARTEAATRTEQIESLSLQLQDIEEVDPGENEDTLLQAQRQVLANAGRLQLLSAESYHGLYEGDHAVLDTLDGIWKKVEELAEIDPAFTAHLETRPTIVSQLEELAYALRGRIESIDASPERLQAVEDRLAKLERLKRRYALSLDDISIRRSDLLTKLEDLNQGSDLETLIAKASSAGESYLEAATELSNKRRAHASQLTKTLEKILTRLAMAHPRFDVSFGPRVSEESNWTDKGVDEAEFYFSANPGEDLRPLARIASGGELSRVMLAIRTVTSTDDHGRTLVFDEVDAGIGGEAAERVGAKLHELARHFQVICVTHLPQIAAYGSNHHRITKSVHHGRTTTVIDKLEDDARASEIARMMTGTHVSGNVLQTAKELLSQEDKCPQESTNEAPEH